MNNSAFQAAYARFCSLWYGSDHGAIEYCLRQAIQKYEKVIEGAVSPAKFPYKCPQCGALWSGQPKVCTFCLADQVNKALSR